jgi:LysR family transcriptional regulator, glycine cleavage system transcriptional activator
LRMFEAAARHVNFTRAAEEFGVTQSAVSRQVTVLEEFLKVPLFERHNSELLLTDAGKTYLRAIQPALDMVSEATAAMRSQTPNQLTIRSYLTFAMQWLLPRLPRFREQHPKIEITVMTSTAPLDFESDTVDLSIRYGYGGWPRSKSWLLFNDQLTPVYATSLADGAMTLDELGGKTLLTSRNRLDDWSDWLKFAGLDLETPQKLVFETSSLVYEAARQGLGVAIGQPRLLESELARRELTAPFPVLERPFGYYLMHAETITDPKIEAFRDWLLQEASAKI